MSMHCYAIPCCVTIRVHLHWPWWYSVLHVWVTWCSYYWLHGPSLTKTLLCHTLNVIVSNQCILRSMNAGRVGEKRSLCSGLSITSLNRMRGLRPFRNHEMMLYFKKHFGNIIERQQRLTTFWRTEVFQADGTLLQETYWTGKREELYVLLFLTK